MPKFTLCRLAGAINIAAALLVGDVWFSAEALTDNVKQNWQGSLEDMASIDASLLAIDHTRQPLWGDSLEGRAFSNYDVVLATLRSFEEAPGCTAGAEIVRLFADDTTRDEASQQMLAEGFLDTKAVELLAAIRRGAHQVDASPNPVIQQRPPIGWYEAMSLVSLGHAHAAKLEAEGQSVEAARICLDLAQMGTDHMGVPLFCDQMTGQEICIAALLGPSGVAEQAGDEARLLNSMSAAGRREWLDALPVLIERFDRSSHAIDGELLRHIVTAKRVVDRESQFGDSYWMYHGRSVRETEEIRAGLKHVCTTTDPESDSYIPAALQWVKGIDGDTMGSEEMLRSLIVLEKERLSHRDELIAVQVALLLDLEGSAEGAAESEQADLRATILDETIEVTWHCRKRGHDRTLRITRTYHD